MIYKWLNATAVSPIYLELIQFRDKHGANMCLLKKTEQTGRQNKLKKTEQTGYVLETEIVPGVFLPVADDNTEYSIESCSALKIFVIVIHTFLHEFFLRLSPESSKLEWKSNFEFIGQIIDGDKIEPPYKFKFDTIVGFVLKL